MARNGSGTYTLPYPTFTTGTPISSTQVNANNTDLTTAMTGSLPRDGQAAPTANIPFGNYKITGLGAGSAATDSITLGQTQAHAFIWATVGGTADVITLTVLPAITAYAAGQCFRFVASGDNTGAVTVAVSGLVAKSIKKTVSAAAAALAAGDIKEAGIYEIVYDGTQFRIFDVAGGARLAVAQTFSGGQRTASSALTSTSNHIAVDLALNNDFTHTLSEDTTLDNPTNIVAGQKGRIMITQAASAKTLAYGSYWDFAGGTVPTVSTGSGEIDVLYYDVLTTTKIACSLVKDIS